jgi:hypothetical protein
MKQDMKGEKRRKAYLSRSPVCSAILIQEGDEKLLERFLQISVKETKSSS